MKFEEISSPFLSLRVKPRNTSEKLRAGDVLSIKTTATRGEFEIYTDETVTKITPTNPASVNSLAEVLSTGRAVLAQLTDPAPDGSAELHLALFNGEPLEMGDLEIGVDEKVQTALKKDTLDEAARTLWGKCVCKHGGKTWFCIVAGEAAKTYLEGKESSGQEDPNESDDTAVQEPEKSYRHFAIIGADLRFALAEKDKSNGQTIFLASRITRTRNRREDPALRLARGNLKFVDWTAAGERAVLARFQLDKLTQNDSSYLKKWDEFGEFEGKLLLERARKVGAIPFSVKEENKEGTITVQCESLTDAQKGILNDVTELEVVGDEDLPKFLNDPSMTYSEFAEGIADDEFLENFLGEKKASQQEKQGNSKTQTFKVDDFNAATGELRLKTDSVPSGRWLIASIGGEIAQIKRRRKARKDIQTGRAANPGLGLLIEENGQIPPSQPPAKMKPLTAFVKQKVFHGNSPTMAQERAIEAALNTPDIALIQGPPGTGKTTVIAAIIERLNEESDKRDGLSGRVLLSGFQHDAVENMIGRLTLNGLPVPKFGQRSGNEQNQDLSRFERQLQEWCESRAAELRTKNPYITESIEEQSLQNLCVQYINAPTLSLAIILLETSLKLSDLTLGEELRKRLQKELKSLKMEQDNEPTENPKLNVIRCIRVTKTGFSDDGADRAGDAFYALKDELGKADTDLLDQARHWLRKEEIPPFLKDLKMLKDRLLKNFTPAPIFRMEKTRDTVVNLINETLGKVRQNGLTARDKKTAALAELLLEIENNPAGILDAVKDYCFAFAATCQQSVNKGMQKMKGIRPRTSNQTLQYDFVIVDEAARVSPRDLMIPMAQGKRIILVGDHRQLPQLIDEEVAKRMEEGSETIGENEWLKKSMFEYLFTERLAKLEEADGIQRRVTLDTQYRTHPLLGDFISRNFYEHFNTEEKFTSGLPESHFSYDLPGTDGKCAMWLNVPQKSGGMKKSGTSQTRPAEADAICEKLKEWIRFDDKRTSDPKKRLTFGVITFYKAQAEFIAKTLGNKFLESVGEERLRIGTVDAFQGMEFDIVFLSLVRTGAKNFGFLQLYNRLNVSMSRQKKLLVAVGDAAFYDTAAAKEIVPGLADFLKLCREKGVIR